MNGDEHVLVNEGERTATVAVHFFSGEIISQSLSYAQSALWSGNVSFSEFLRSNVGETPVGQPGAYIRFSDDCWRCHKSISY